MEAENPQALEPILSVDCNEGRGIVTRRIYLMQFTKENLEKFYNRSRRYRTLFWKETEGDFAKFLTLLLRQDSDGTVRPNGVFWVVDDFVGVYFLTHIIPGEDAQVHYTFFDGQHEGRDTLTKAMLKWVFENLKFRRLSAEIPAYAAAYVTRFARSVGFKGEGLKRKASFYKEDWFDVKLYGILQEEALKPDV